MGEALKEGKRMGYRGRTAGLSMGAAAVALGLILAGGTPAPAIAQAVNPGDRIVQRVDLVDADLTDAISLLKAETGIEIVIESSDKPYGRVTLSLNNPRPLVEVLRIMCKHAGATFREEGGIFVIAPQDAKPKTVDPEPAKPAPTPPAPRRLRSEKIRLQNARPTEILYYFGIDQRNLASEARNDRGTINIDPYRNIPRPSTPNIQDLAKNNGNGGNNAAPVPLPQVPPVVPVQGGSDKGDEFYQGFGGIGGGRGGGQGGFGGIGGGRGGGGFGGLGGGQGGLGQGGQGQGAAGALLPEGIESVIGFDLDNSLIVIGDDEAIREMRKRVALLDIAPRQVMVRAEFVTLSQNDLRTFGIDWQVARGNLLAGNSGFAGGPVFLNYATGNVVAQLRATLTEGRARLINSPMATTLNNVPVVLILSRQVPVFVTSPVAAGNGTVVLQTALIPVPVASGLQVQPRINGDESISMTVTPFLSDIVDTVTGPEGTTAPVISSQSITVSRRIRNGETMVIGGLITRNDQTSIRRVPLFGDLPLIGGLFQGRSVTVADSELLIFITPSIIRDTPAGGATVGGLETGGVPGGIRP